MACVLPFDTRVRVQLRSRPERPPRLHSTLREAAQLGWRERPVTHERTVWRKLVEWDTGSSSSSEMDTGRDSEPIVAMPVDVPRADESQRHSAGANAIGLCTSNAKRADESGVAGIDQAVEHGLCAVSSDTDCSDAATIESARPVQGGEGSSGEGSPVAAGAQGENASIWDAPCPDGRQMCKHQPQFATLILCFFADRASRCPGGERQASAASAAPAGAAAAEQTAAPAQTHAKCSQPTAGKQGGDDLDEGAELLIQFFTSAKMVMFRSFRSCRSCRSCYRCSLVFLPQKFRGSMPGALD